MGVEPANRTSCFQAQGHQPDGCEFNCIQCPWCVTLRAPRPEASRFPPHLQQHAVEDVVRGLGAPLHDPLQLLSVSAGTPGVPLELGEDLRGAVRGGQVGDSPGAYGAQGDKKSRARPEIVCFEKKKEKKNEKKSDVTFKRCYRYGSKRTGQTHRVKAWAERRGSAPGPARSRTRTWTRRRGRPTKSRGTSPLPWRSVIFFLFYV